MKNTTYIAEITSEKNKEWQVSAWGEKSTCLLTRSLFASCELRNFPREFTQKCFAVFNQSSHPIYLTWH